MSGGLPPAEVLDFLKSSGSNSSGGLAAHVRFLSPCHPGGMKCHIFSSKSDEEGRYASQEQHTKGLC